MLLKFPTTKAHFVFPAPAAQLTAAEIPQAHEQRTPFSSYKALMESGGLYYVPPRSIVLLVPAPGHTARSGVSLALRAYRLWFIH